jgi:hypothetical protein
MIESKLLSFHSFVMGEFEEAYGALSNQIIHTTILK